MTQAARRNTPDLERLQACFQSYILGDDAAMRGFVRATLKATPELLLGVYRDAYALRLLEALGANFPILKRLVGGREFDALGRAYIEAHPSRHASIRWYGDALEKFLEAAAPWREAPHLAEMAAFEWALTLAFDAADAAPIGAETLAAVAPGAWAGMRLGFHPSLRTLDSAFAVPEAWKAMEGSAEALTTPARRAAPVEVAVWRSGLETYFRALEGDEAAALAEARGGAAFGAVCERLCNFVEPEEAGALAARHLRQWVDSGWIAGVKT